jgi:hypothetical protein
MNAGLSAVAMVLAGMVVSMSVIRASEIAGRSRHQRASTVFSDLIRPTDVQLLDILLRLVHEKEGRMRSLLDLDKPQLTRLDQAIAAPTARRVGERMAKMCLLQALESEKQELVRCNPAIRLATRMTA